MLQQLRLKEYAEHQCQLNTVSDSCLPDLPPQTGKYKRLLHDYRKYLTVSKANPRTKQFYRSISAIKAEKKRQIYTVPKYVVHPFSKFSIAVECIMFLLWFYGYLFDPIFVAFYEMESIDTPLVIITLIVNTLLTMYIGLCFITGYQIAATKEIVLEPKKIAVHYIKTYFFFDLVGSVPMRHIATVAHADFDDVYHNLLSALHLFRIARIGTAMQYFRQVTMLLRIDDPGHVLATMIIMTFLFLHWISCIVYLSNKLLYYITGSIQGHSWLRRMGISAAQDDVRWYRRYLVCLHTVAVNFYAAGAGMELTFVFCEHIIMSIIMIFGSIYYVYALIITLQLVRSATTSESKYEEFLYQLNDYMRAKLLPSDLRKRIVLYYEHRFQKKFFREHAILSSLSEHLRHEIFLQNCKHLMSKVALFKELPKNVVGLILANLKHEVFLPNDRIVSNDAEAGAMYFISYGAVAVYNSTGHECLHLTDGMHFGAASLTGQHEKYGYNCVSIEMTECYRWDKADYLKCASMYKGIADIIANITERSIRKIVNAEQENVYSKNADVLSDLRRGKIIESGIYRNE
ncbi:hypothetical protein Trydic_g18284 [Trypoxylus dichotomus]